MSFNTFGKMFRFTTWGESHGPAIGCVVDGCPPNIALSEKNIQEDMNRRRPGKLAGEHIINYMRWVCHWRGLGNHMDPGEELPETKHKLDLLNYDFLHKRNLLFGTPEYVVNKINELKSELNLQNLQVWSNFPGIDHKACMKSIKLFNDEVIPKINFDNDDIEKAS